MTDRRTRTAVLLVVLGGVLAGVGSTLDMFSEAQFTTGASYADVGSLWGLRSTPQAGPDLDTALEEGLPIVVAAALMVVAALLTLRRGRTAAVARPAVLVAGGVFAGLVLTFVAGVVRRGEVARSLSEAATPVWRYEQDLLPGFHLLAAAAVVGLTGAVLAQRPRDVVAEPEREAVVVHRMTDDDTPPFGIAVQEQEAR